MNTRQQPVRMMSVMSQHWCEAEGRQRAVSQTTAVTSKHAHMPLKVTHSQKLLYTFAVGYGV
jgi:hypothetical protein